MTTSYKVYAIERPMRLIGSLTTYDQTMGDFLGQIWVRRWSGLRDMTRLSWKSY